jgi:hypothetical protein
MDVTTTTQLITAAATLGGVVLTLVTSSYLERRRANDTRELESLRLASEQVRWMRDERLKAYSALSTAGEEIHQFLRSELPTLLAPNGLAERGNIEVRWRTLRTGLRKAYNQVVLFGTTDTRDAAMSVWRVARNTGSDFLRDLDANADAPNAISLAEQLRSGASRLGTVGERFLEACRKDFQGE